MMRPNANKRKLNSGSARWKRWGDRDHSEESNSCEKKKKKANPKLGGVAMLCSQISNPTVELSHNSENETLNVELKEDSIW
ncbi:putative 5' nucleotidase [Corchorus capsularis]|uniref:Putative 5' nucleotidase n=1 Tax=Corchorus capsularis TaxID=210143 RepID=A0A1R3G796_COCAP|nr:putative 5' nucleotidase [Corchorus capsularis]